MRDDLNPTAKLTLEPSGSVMDVPMGSSLRDVLFDRGLEFPCGGTGTCRGCLVKISMGSSTITETDTAILHPHEIQEGWRLGCQCQVIDDMTITLPDWDMQILADSNPIDSISDDMGLGIAIDIGTTTLAAQLVERSTLKLLNSVTAQNSQGRFGSDVMSRLDHALNRDQGSMDLSSVIEKQIESMIDTLLGANHETEVTSIIMVGNTAMHHLFAGLPPQSLAHFPFNPASMDAIEFRARERGWKIPGNPEVSFLPNLGGFVGSDILAGILATGMYQSTEPVALIDLGTNGEIVIGNRDGFICASAAAGPAFEGARIEMGMSAISGAVSEVYHEDGEIRVKVIGGGDPRGICGSGLVDAIALGLDLGIIAEDGRLHTGDEWELVKPLRLTQADIREVQLAKGAIAAGFSLLLKKAGLNISDLKTVYLAGGFGNYIHAEKALRLGLLKCSLEQISPIGNSALRGAKLALQQKSQPAIQKIQKLMQHVELALIPEFQESFADSMFFKDYSKN